VLGDVHGHAGDDGLPLLLRHEYPSGKDIGLPVPVADAADRLDIAVCLAGKREPVIGPQMVFPVTASAARRRRGRGLLRPGPSTRALRFGIPRSKDTTHEEALG